MSSATENGQEKSGVFSPGTATPESGAPVQSAAPRTPIDENNAVRYKSDDVKPDATTDVRPARRAFRPRTAAGINRAATGRLFLTFLVFDAVLLLFLCWAFMWQTESRAMELRTAYQYISEPSKSFGNVYPGGTEQTVVTNESGAVYIPEAQQPYGFVFVPWLQNLMPGGNAVRELVRPAKHLTDNLYMPVYSGYGLYFPDTGDYISMPVTRELALLRIIMIAVLFFQLLQLMWFSMGNRSSVERKLLPYTSLIRDAGCVLGDPLHTRFASRPCHESALLTDALNDVLDSAAEIHRSYGEQSRFVSDASHELRTPIAVIQGYANMLDRWGKDDPVTLEEAIQALKNEADGMQRLVEQLLFLSRGDSGNIRLQPAPLELQALMREVYQEAMMIDDGHEYRLDADSAVTVMADSGLLKQSLRILIDNSRKYTAEHGQIILACRQDGRHARLSVEDTGMGIESQDVPRIFDRFFRADQSRTRKTGGSGLGLSIAKWIIERHHGSIEVLSRVGAGTRITFALPLPEHEPEADRI